MEITNKIFRLGYKYLSGHKLYRYAPFKQFIHYVYSKNRKIEVKNEPIDILGHKMLLDKEDTLNLRTRGIFEKNVTALIVKSLQEGDVAIDVGSHIGYHTLLMARAVGKTGKVYAFEPDPINFKILSDNISLNGYNNVILVNKAISNKNSEMIFYINKRDTANSSLYKQIEESEIIKIDTVTLNDFLKSTKVKLIKMIVEGAEKKVLEGATTILDNNNIILISCYYPAMLDKAKESKEDYLNLLFSNFDYIKDINKNKQIISPSEISNESLGGGFIYIYCQKNIK